MIFKPRRHIDTITKERVLATISEKPESRYDLAAKSGVSERTFREVVRALRREGYPIVADSHSKGYKIGTRSEVTIAARELRSRAIDMLRTANAMEGADPNQITMEDL